MLLPLLLFAAAQAAPSAHVIQPPAGAVVVATAEGRGSQVYHCAQEDGSFKWTFDAPDARLYKPGTTTLVGTHSIGPTWTWNDGSSIKGVVAGNQPAPSKTDIPWLLLKTSTMDTATGTLAHVTWVRRSDTKGGVAPGAGCDAAHEGTVKQVPYTATYTFYSGAKDAQPGQ